MPDRLFFIEQKLAVGHSQHRWLLMHTDGSFIFSDIQDSRPKMMSDCVDSLGVGLLEQTLIFEDLSEGTKGFLQSVAKKRSQRDAREATRQRKTQDLDRPKFKPGECLNDNHDPGCQCGAKHDNDPGSIDG